MLILVLGARWAGASPVELHADQRDYSLGVHLEWVRDAGHLLTIEELLKNASLQWVSQTDPVPNLGYSDDAIWFRCDLYNLDGIANWNLAINYPLIRDLDLFVVRSGVVAEVFQTGDRFEFSARPVQHRDFIFPLVVKPGQSATLYLRVSGPYSHQMPLRLLDEYSLLMYESRASLLHGLFFGFVLVMALYNFFLFLSTREQCYLFYVFFSASIGMFQLTQQGLAYQFVWPHEIWWQNKSTGIFIHLSLLSAFLFVSEFLELKARLPVFYRAFQLVAAAALVMLALTPFVNEFFVMYIGVLLSLPACVLAILGGWIVWRKGRSDARVFSLAWASFLLGVLALSLNKLGLVPRNFLTEHGAEIGTVVELALLAFALAGRINRERQQRLELELQTRELERSALVAKEHALEMERLSNEQLERNVRERTTDLHKALAELSDMNRKLELMNTQDPVTGVGNENIFLRALKQEWERAYRSSESLSLLVVELDGYRDVVADYGQVAAEECLKNVADILARLISRPADVITRYGDKVFGVLLPATDATGAMHLAQKVAQQVCEIPFDFGICQIRASVSIGIASEHASKVDRHKELLLSAESAVYVAQNSGGNQIQLAKMQNASG
jgi:diguanylate cyclase